MEINSETNTKPQIERSEPAGPKKAQEPIFIHKETKELFLVAEYWYLLKVKTEAGYKPEE